MIKITNLSKSFNGKKVLKNLNLEINTGETLVILGRSGAGKSVLLRHIIGLEKPDSGKIEIDGVDINSQKSFESAKEMGLLFQAGALFDSMTIEENTAFYLKEHKMLSNKEIKDRVHYTLGMVGLEGTENMMPSDLSGGMRKRAALARLIAYRPKILLYDEPTTGLDPITAMHINDLIIKTQKELGATSIVVTHDLCSAFHIADRIALNDDGQIVYITTKEEFAKIEHPLVKLFIKNSTL